MKIRFSLEKWIIFIAIVLLTAGISSASGLDAFKGEKGILRISGGTSPHPGNERSGQKSHGR